MFLPSIIKIFRLNHITNISFDIYGIQKTADLLTTNPVNALIQFSKISGMIPSNRHDYHIQILVLVINLAKASLSTSEELIIKNKLILSRFAELINASISCYIKNDIVEFYKSIASILKFPLIFPNINTPNEIDPVGTESRELFTKDIKTFSASLQNEKDIAAAYIFIDKWRDINYLKSISPIELVIAFYLRISFDSFGVHEETNNILNKAGLVAKRKDLSEFAITLANNHLLSKEEDNMHSIGQNWISRL